jgi:hypothetical protein
MNFTPTPARRSFDLHEAIRISQGKERIVATRADTLRGYRLRAAPPIDLAGIASIQRTFT